MGTPPKEHMVMVYERPDELAGALDDAVAEGWQVIGYAMRPETTDQYSGYSALLQRDKKD